MNIENAMSGPFQALEELSNVMVEAFAQGYTDSEASFVIPYRGFDLKITISLDKEDD